MNTATATMDFQGQNSVNDQLNRAFVAVQGDQPILNSATGDVVDGHAAEKVLEDLIVDSVVDMLGDL